MMYYNESMRGDCFFAIPVCTNTRINFLSPLGCCASLNPSRLVANLNRNQMARIGPKFKHTVQCTCFEDSC